MEKQGGSAALSDSLLPPGAGAKHDASLEGGVVAPGKQELGGGRNNAAEASIATVLTLASGQVLCAAGLLVVNKWALNEFPFVWTLTSLQFLFAAVFAFLAGACGLVHVDALTWERFVFFFPAAGMFFIIVTTGNAVLGTTNVETFVVMRAVTPIQTAFLESAVLQEPFPPLRSWVGLFIVVAGTLCYCVVNSGLLVGSWTWVLFYQIIIPIDAVVVKHVVTESKMSPWGLVLYNNVCAVIVGIVYSALFELGSSATRAKMSHIIDTRPFSMALPVAISCVAGLALSYFQLNVRKVISSTAFMVLGVSNKILAVLFSQLAHLDSNSSPVSLLSVFTSIFGAIWFQQNLGGKGVSQVSRISAQKSAQGQSVARIFVMVGLVVAASVSFARSPAS